MRKDTSRVITKADKGNCYVVVDRKDYDEKMETLLDNSKTYQKVKKPPFKRLKQQF